MQVRWHFTERKLLRPGPFTVTSSDDKKLDAQQQLWGLPGHLGQKMCSQ